MSGSTTRIAQGVRPFVTGMAAPRTLRSPGDLIAAGLADETSRLGLDRVAGRYAIAVTPAMTALIDKGDTNDPIARQFVPDVRELQARPHELDDPIADHPYSPVAGVVHRYRNRVLLKITHVCPVYCRFCFRREMVGPHNSDALSPQQVDTALAYIGTHSEISEVILTGGDPFILSPRRIREVAHSFDRMPHVEILRWHTRVPVVDTERVTPDLVAALTSSSKTVMVAIHINHAREMTEEARHAIATLDEAGVGLLSQTVLLKGVNDDATTLEGLLRALIACRIKPYYLHHGDLAPGTAHFRTTIERGKALMEELRGRLPDHALPAYVLDIPGGHGKVEIASHVIATGPGTYRVRDPSGQFHDYRDVTE